VRTRFLAYPQRGRGFSSWPWVLIGFVVLKAILSLAPTQVSVVVAVNWISYFLLLLLATGLAARNAAQNRLGNRAFWVFLALAVGLWALDQWLYVYYGLILHSEIPDNSIADPALFVHLVPLMAAVATLPHRKVSDRKLYLSTLNFLCLLFFWSFAYGYVVFPYQYLLPDATSYAQRFDILYLVENLALVSGLIFVTLQAESPWKSIYLNLLGASALYTVSSTVANLAIDSGGYVNGRLYGVGLTASVCWFVWIPLRALRFREMEMGATETEGRQNSLMSVWAMLAVVMISLPLAWHLFKNNEHPALQMLRQAVTVAALVGLTSAAFMKEHLTKRDLASRISLAHDRLRLALESGKSVGWDRDVRSGRSIWFGDLDTLFGIPSGEFAGLWEDFLGRILQDDRGQVEKAVNDAMEHHQSFAEECRIIRPNGTMRWIATQGTFHYATNGKPDRMLGVAVDITERKQAQESLKLFRMLIDQSNDAIYVILPETLRVVDANGRACLDLGYTREELLLMTVHDIDPKVSEFGRIDDELRNSGSILFEARHRRKNGSTFPVEVSIKQIQVERTYRVAVARDITDREQAQMALRCREESYRNFVAQSSEGIFRQDLDAPIPLDLPEDEVVRRILYDSYLGECNDALARMYGLSSQREFLGKRLTETLDPNDPRNIELTRDFVRSSFRILERESHEVDMLGAHKVFSNSMIGIVEDGRLLQTWGIQRDVTERVILEEDRKQSELALQETRAELARVARIVTMGELTASIAHEINQPLAAASINASAALRWLATEPPNLEEAREAASMAIMEINRSSHVIRRVRNFLQKSSPELHPVDVREVIQEVLALAHHELVTAEVTVHTELSADIPETLGDRVQLQQVILNLITNAIDAMLITTDRPKTVLVKAVGDGDNILVLVQDNGRGLDPNYADRIFEPFFTTKPAGIGLGLSITKTIIENHGGRLWAASGSPLGTVFQFTLPAHDG
jgi:PAS domain S-box-containing protein